MRRTFILSSILLTSLILSACQKKEATVFQDHRIRFTVEEASPYVSSSIATKATEVKALDEVYVTATRGEAGSETVYFSNKVFTKEGRWYVSDETWPMLDPNLHFYASNIPMTFDAAGTYITTSTDNDAVVGYIPSPNIERPNGLLLTHVFSRVKTVTCTNKDGFDISDIEIRVTPKVSGTYNLRTGLWSDTATGAPVTVSSSSLGPKEQDLWLIPGTYWISCTWTASKTGCTPVTTNAETRMTFEAGKISDFIIVLGGEGIVINSVINTSSMVGTSSLSANTINFSQTGTNNNWE